MTQEPLLPEVLAGEAVARAAAYQRFRAMVLPQALAIVGASFFPTLFKGSMETSTEGAFELAQMDPSLSWADIAEGLAKSLITRIGGDAWDTEEGRELLLEIRHCTSH